MTSHITRFSRRVAALAALAVLVPATALAAIDDVGDGQVIDPNQTQGTGQVVLDAGHVDAGPTFGTGEWALQIHDDTTAERAWRNPEDVVLQVSDAAILNVPDDPAFGFLQLAPGTPVHVVPQTEASGVVWVGWNTQEPNLLAQLNMGATLRIHDIQGPGSVTTYLQGGNFGEPQVLWSTHEAFPQDIWVEINTHTHANWVFSEPGVYLVDMEFFGDLITGEPMSARGTLRFAVGDATDPQAAFTAELVAAETPAPGETAAPDESEPAASDDAASQSREGDNGMTWFVLGIAAAILIGAVAFVALRGVQARREAREIEGDE